jgi:hypothetical protein
VALPSIQHNRTIRASISLVPATTQLVRTSINLVKAPTILVLHSIKINIRTTDSRVLHSLIKIHMEVELVTIPNPRRTLCTSPLHTLIRTRPRRIPRIPCTISHRPHLTSRTVRPTTETLRPPGPTPLPRSVSLTPVRTRETAVSRACPPPCHRARQGTPLSPTDRLSIKTACHPIYKLHP